MARKKAVRETAPVTIRLSPVQVAMFQRKANAACVSRSAYIALRLNGEEPESYPTLAALAHVVAMHETVRTTGLMTRDQLDELRLILGAFAKLARAEVSR